MIEQLGTPKEVYNNPRTLFVAGFIGSPPMNLVPGSVENGVFSGSDLRIEGLGQVTAQEAVMGVRPEDVEVVDADAPDANVVKPIYASELTGESTLVTVRTGDVLFNVRTDKDFEGEIDEPVGVRINFSKVYLFDAKSTQRIDY